jgi:hypothetical protein
MSLGIFKLLKCIAVSAHRLEPSRDVFHTPVFRKAAIGARSCSQVIDPIAAVPLREKPAAERLSRECGFGCHRLCSAAIAQ